MKVSLNWLKEYIEDLGEVDARALAELFTARTAEVEGVDEQSQKFTNMVVGQIKEILPHPNADKLRITRTDIGTETLQIICGANNIFVGQFVPVALVGAEVRWHGEGDLVKLEPAKIRGVESFGMICAADEIGLSEEKSEGIFDLGHLSPRVGMSLAEALGQDDTILTIDNKSLTHRPDLWGHYGIARELAAITKKTLKPLEINLQLSPNGTPPQVELRAKKLCSRYLALKIDGIKVEASPAWLQKRLAAIGYRSINNIVDITNYVMAELGQPLHAFDATKVKGGIVIRTAKKGEKIVTLDQVERELDIETLVIADHQKPVAIAGVMGGANSEIDAATTSILLESATFNPSSVRKTSVRLGLRTEAVQRFEKSLDPHLAEQALKRAAELILKVCPGSTVAAPPADLRNWKEKTIKVSLDLKKLTSKLGKQIPSEEVKTILESLAFTTELKGKKIKVTVPSFRATKDINLEDDLVEEVARLHGYENIEAVLPSLPTRLPEENRERKLKHRARQILSLGLGFDEVYNYSFYSLKDIQKALLPEELHVKVQNYLSEDQTHLRISLVPNILKNIGNNLKHFDQFRLYEIGRTYENLQEYFPLEEKKIVAAIVRKKKTSDSLFYDAKGALEAFLKTMKIDRSRLQKGQTFCPYAHPNRHAEYQDPADDTVLARVFELHPLVAKNFDLGNADIALFEINFTRLAHIPPRELTFKPLPRFPGIEIDISVVIDEKTEIGTLEKAVRDSDRELVQSVRLFDLYKGPNIASGKKALAFKVLLQSSDRTLTDLEMKEVQQKAFEKLLSLGGEIRGLTNQ